MWVVATYISKAELLKKWLNFMDWVAERLNAPDTNWADKLDAGRILDKRMYHRRFESYLTPHFNVHKLKKTG